MPASILLVGEHDVLLQTRALILREWETSILVLNYRVQPIERSHDLVLFCHTVPDDKAEELAAQAAALNPGVKVLALCQIGQERQLKTVAAHYMVEIAHPEHLQDAVHKLLG